MSDAPEAPVRLRLARLAAAVVEASGTVTLTAGTLGTWTTRAASESVHGVEVHAAADERYELELHLLVAWPPQPLHVLADELRDAIARAARSAGVGDELGPIEVHFEGLDEPVALSVETAR